MRCSVVELPENILLVCDAEMGRTFDYYSLTNFVTVKNTCISVHKLWLLDIHAAWNGKRICT